jgi:hypothetical protein
MRFMNFTINRKAEDLGSQVVIKIATISKGVDHLMALAYPRHESGLDLRQIAD